MLKIKQAHTQSNRFCRNCQFGFTLIELMVVIAILGTLAAIAITQYKQFTDRAKFSEVYSLASGYQKEAVEYFAVNGEVIPDRFDTINSEYIRHIQYWTNSNGNQSMHIYLQNFYDGWHANQAMIFQGYFNNANASMKWDCCNHRGWRVLPENILPKECRNQCPEH